MFEKLSDAQRAKLAWLVLDAELGGFTVSRKHPLPGTFLQDADVYAVCESNKAVAKQIFANVIRDPLAAPEELDAQLTFRDDLVKKGFFVDGRDEFWVVNFGRYDVLCAHYTQIKGFELKDAEWIKKRIIAHMPDSRSLRLYVSTLQGGGLLPR